MNIERNPLKNNPFEGTAAPRQSMSFGDIVAPKPAAAAPAQQEPPATAEKVTLHPGILAMQALDADGWHNVMRFDPSEKRKYPLGKTFPPHSWDAIADYINVWNGVENLYFSVNEPRPNAPDGKLEKTEIANIRAVFSDVDPRDGFALSLERDRLHKLADDVSAGPVPPSLVIDSGSGVQMVWKLEAKLPFSGDVDNDPHLKAAEELGRGVGHELGGDPTQNIDRILRMPGTINIPNALKLRKGRTAAYATADAKRAEMNRLAQLFDYSQAKDFDQQRFDRMGAATGQWTPSQGYYAVDQGNATQRYGYDRTFEASRLNNAADNARALEEHRMQESGLMERQNASPIILNEGQRAFLPAQTAEATELMQILEGGSKPLSETEWKAQQSQRLLDSGRLTDQDLLDAISGDNTPVKAIDPRTKQPVFMTPGTATRTGAQPYEAASAERVDNYLAVGPTGEEVRFPGIVGADGRIINANTGQIVPNVVRKEGTGGGMSFEADGQGGVRFTTGGAGNTVSQQTQLQGQRDAAARSARELQTLFDNISASDVGVAGNLNDFLTNYGAQVWPEVARGDTTAMRSQMQATTMTLARSLSGDSRISDTDRRMAQEVMVGQGLGESLPGAKAKLAALTVLHAYRQKFAGALAEGGEVLPPINRAVVGQLVDDGAISPALAQTYVETMLSNSRGGPTRLPVADNETVRETDQDPPAVPSGVDPADWEFMTPEQKALFR